MTISPRIRATSWISRFLAALYTVPPFGGVRRRYIWLGKRFDKYAILGDDICIADSKVAEVYLSTLKDLGVTISLPKSLVSDVGGAEFAKKFRCKNLTVDLSPLFETRLIPIQYMDCIPFVISIRYRGFPLYVDCMVLVIGFLVNLTTLSRLQSYG